MVLRTRAGPEPDSDRASAGALCGLRWAATHSKQRPSSQSEPKPSRRVDTTLRALRMTMPTGTIHCSARDPMAWFMLAASSGLQAARKQPLAMVWQCSQCLLQRKARHDRQVPCTHSNRAAPHLLPRPLRRRPSVHSTSHSRATSSAFTPVLLTPCCAHSALSCATVCAFSSALFASRASRARRRRRAGGSRASVAPKALPVGAVKDRAVGLGFAAAQAAHRRGSLRTHKHLGKPPRRAMREQRAAHGRPPRTHAHIHAHTAINRHVHSHPRSCKVCLLPRGPLVA